MKRHVKAVTLAIGDGANDVSMIKCKYVFRSSSLNPKDNAEPVARECLG